MKSHIFFYLAILSLIIYALIILASRNFWRDNAAMWQGRYFEELAVKNSILGIK